jgi:hypothetical protein
VAQRKGRSTETKKRVGASLGDFFLAMHFGHLCAVKKKKNGCDGLKPSRRKHQAFFFNVVMVVVNSEVCWYESSEAEAGVRRRH